MVKLDEEIRQLKQRIEAAREARVGAQAQRIAAQEALDRVQKQMAEEFGAHNLDQAQRLLAKLDADVAAELEKVKQHLAAAEDQA